MVQNAHGTETLPHGTRGHMVEHFAHHVKGLCPGILKERNTHAEGSAMERVHLWSLIGAVIVHPRVLSAGVFLILYLHLVF